MKMTTNTSFLIPLLLILFLTNACQSGQEETENLAAIIQKVEQGLSGQVYIKGNPTWTIEERMAHYGVPGLSLAVIKDHKVHWAKTYGTVKKGSTNSVTDQTLFQAASISKPVSAMAALSLVEAGQLDLDGNINDQLKSWQLPDNEFTANKQVALKHLLSHTGGLTVHGFLGYHPGLDVPTLVQLLDGETPANSSAIRVDKEPEQSFRYSGGGYCIAQQLMIDAAGKSFPEVMKERVLDPLGMAISSFAQPLPTDRLSQAATGYLPNGEMTQGERHTYPEMAAAGLWTNADQLAKFAIEMQLSLQGKSNKVLSQEMTKKMLTPFVEDHIGLGIFLNTRGEDQFFEHGGWNEGFSSQLLAHREDGYGIVVMINANQPPFIDEVIQAVARTYDWGDYALVYEKMEQEAADYQALLGRYRMHEDEAASVFVEDDKLFLRIGLEEALELLPIAENKYTRLERTNQIHFKENKADGKWYLDFIDPWANNDFTFQNARMSEEEKLPFEYLSDGAYDKALAAYMDLLKKDPEAEAIQEGRINGVGYQLMGEGQKQLALDILKINTQLYPKAFNAFDSLGEAYMNNGDTKLAIANYKKSLELNPDNTNAVAMLGKMGVEL